MERPLFTRKKCRQRGFTLLETMVAIAVLAIGLLSMAGLMSQMVRGTTNSRFMSTAAMLATEKLEDLGRYASTDAAVANGGDLVSGNPLYSDTVQVSTGSGTISENYNGTIVTHWPNGTVTNAAPAPGPETLTFNRSWQVEAGQPVAGARRITVVVTLQNQAASSPVRFQSSMVRP